MKAYGTIVADPPWPEAVGKDFWPYHFMSLDEIAALPVESVAAEKSHLYLWATQRSLRDAFGVCEAWGFDYKATLVWHKAGFGMGLHYYRHNAEFVVFGVRGKLATTQQNQGMVFTGKKGRHSVKPAESFEMFEVNSPGPRLEMFARAPRSGWDVWGNEVTSDLVLRADGAGWGLPRRGGENGANGRNDGRSLRLAAGLVPWDA